MVETGTTLATSEHWDKERAQGYAKLAWVQARQPLEKIIQLVQLKGDEVVVDAGTGSQAVLDVLAPHLHKDGMIVGFDISLGMMLNREGLLSPNARLVLADIYQTPFADNSVDLVTARHVYHNLPDIEAAVKEAKRILRPEGRLMVIEYTPCTQAYDFDRIVFDLKEPGRNLWTGEQLRDTIAQAWCCGNDQINLDFALLPQNSVVNWMRNSGLPEATQQAVFGCYLNAPSEISKVINLTITDDGDILVDRPFAYVMVAK